MAGGREPGTTGTGGASRQDAADQRERSVFKFRGGKDAVVLVANNRHVRGAGCVCVGVRPCPAPALTGPFFGSRAFRWACDSHVVDCGKPVRACPPGCDRRPDPATASICRVGIRRKRAYKHECGGGTGGSKPAAAHEAPVIERGAPIMGQPSAARPRPFPCWHWHHRCRHEFARPCHRCSREVDLILAPTQLATSTYWPCVAAAGRCC